MLNLFRNTRRTKNLGWTSCASRDYARLDRLGQIYLDYTGGGLYAESQVRAHQKVLAETVFGNPHSSNPTSQAATRLIESTRRSILEFFHADPAEYTVIFSQNASGALKLVGESYPFVPGSHYLLTFDNHNSVNGIREYAHAEGRRCDVRAGGTAEYACGYRIPSALPGDGAGQ